MEFTVSSSVLMRTVNTLSGIISSNSALPILDNLLFEQKNGRLTLSASDMETTMTSTIDVDGQSSGKIAVPAKMLAEILKTFPEQPLTFVAREQEHLLKINYGTTDNEGNCDLPYEEADDYPVLPVLEDVTQTVVTSEILATAIQKTIFATGNDDMRPVMSGVLFKFTPEGLVFVATDAHKLVKYVREDITSPVPVEFIMPKKPLNILKNIFSGLATDVTITFNRTNARFEADDIVLTCRLIDGKYPNYEAVIPKDNPNQLLIDRLSFMSSLRRIALFSNKTTPPDPPEPQPGGSGHFGRGQRRRQTRRRKDPLLVPGRTDGHRLQFALPLRNAGQSGKQRSNHRHVQTQSRRNPSTAGIQRRRTDHHAGHAGNPGQLTPKVYRQTTRLPGAMKTISSLRDFFSQKLKPFPSFSVLSITIFHTYPHHSYFYSVQ